MRNLQPKSEIDPSVTIDTTEPITVFSPWPFTDPTVELTGDAVYIDSTGFMDFVDDLNCPLLGHNDNTLARLTNGRLAVMSANTAAALLSGEMSIKKIDI